MTNRIYAMDTHFASADPKPTPTEQVAMIKAAGFDDYYVSGSFSSNKGYEKFQTLVAAAKAAGLGFSAAFDAINVLEAPDAKALGRVERVLKELPKGARLEIAMLAGAMGEHAGDSSVDDQAVAWLKPISELLEKYDIEGSLYPHFMFYLETFQDALRLARKVNHPKLKVMFCSYHWFFVEKNQGRPQPTYQELFAKAGKLLNAVNLCGSIVFASEEEADGRMNPSISPLDEGDKDIDGILAELNRIGFNGPIGVQGYQVTDTAESALNRSAKKLRELIH